MADRVARDLAPSDVATLQSLITLFSTTHAQALRLTTERTGADVHRTLVGMLERLTPVAREHDLAKAEVARLSRSVRLLKQQLDSMPLPDEVNVMVVGKGWHGLYQATKEQGDVYVVLVDAGAIPPASHVGISAAELVRGIDAAFEPPHGASA